MRKIDKIIIHYSSTIEGKDFKVGDIDDLDKSNIIVQQKGSSKE